MSSLLDLSIKNIHEKLLAKEFSARELTQAFISHIQKTDGKIQAYLRNDFDGALAKADEVDKKISISDPISPIAGIPAAIRFSGLAPAWVGLYQVNLEVPQSVPAGALPLVLTSNGLSSNPVTVFIGP